MLGDAEIRRRVVALAEAVDDGAESALAEVVRGVSSDRRRVLVTRVAVVSVLLATMAGVWFSSVRGSVERDERYEPTHETIRRGQRDRSNFESTRRIQRDSRADRGDRGESSTGAQARGRPRRSSERGLNGRPPATVGPDEADLENRRGNGEVDNDPLRDPTRDRVSRRLSAHYERPVAKGPRIDPRQNCYPFGEGCVGFETRPEDRFVRVLVQDDSAGDVLVRITQWDREGRTVGDPIIYCGGESEKVEIRSSADHVMVEIDSGNCADGRDSSASGGVVDFVFFHG